jgi:hypothetical protein
MEECMSRRTSETLVPAFADIADEDLESMLANATPVLRDVLDGQHLAEVGERGNGFSSFMGVDQ